MKRLICLLLALMFISGGEKGKARNYQLKIVEKIHLKRGLTPSGY